VLGLFQENKYINYSKGIRKVSETLSPDELIDKVTYYLKHDEEREPVDKLGY